MDPLEIKILMMRAGVTQNYIAKKLGVTPAFVNQIISRTRCTEYVRKAIAKAVKRPVEEIFPGKENQKRKAA